VTALRHSFVTRIVLAARLDADLYEEVEADRSAELQAASVVLMAATAAGIGSFENASWPGMAVSGVAALLSWIAWAFITFWIGTRLLPQAQTRADPGELRRTIGFSAAPGILTILGVIPGVAPWIYILCGLWMLAAMVIAVRQALDYDGTLRAVAVCIIGFPFASLLLALTILTVGPWPV
jgi:hypothetical protein